MADAFKRGQIVSNQPPAAVDAEAELLLAQVGRVLGRAASDLHADPRTAKLVALVEQMCAYGRHREVPVREIFARLGDRWSTLLLLLLQTGSLRHSELRRLASVLGAEAAISQRMLTLRLRALERDGLVDRVQTDSIPPRVDYALTALGHGLCEQMGLLISWVQAHHGEIESARASFEARRTDPH